MGGDAPPYLRSTKASGGTKKIKSAREAQRQQKRQEPREEVRQQRRRQSAESNVAFDLAIERRRKAIEWSGLGDYRRRY